MVFPRTGTAALLLVLSACGIVDGSYVVRGTVMTYSEAVATPVAGASVAVGDTGGRTTNGSARTSADGKYEALYSFGGMFPFISGAHPAVEFSAPGYRSRTVDLLSSKAPPGVTRKPCDPPVKGCFVVNVALDSEN